MERRQRRRWRLEEAGRVVLRRRGGGVEGGVRWKGRREMVWSWSSWVGGGVVVVAVLEAARVGIFHGWKEWGWFLAVGDSFSLHRALLLFLATACFGARVPWLARGSYSAREGDSGQRSTG